MALPNVKIELGNGALGSIGDTGDGIAGLIMTGNGTVGIPLATPKVIYSLSEAIALGITEAAEPAAYRHIKEFYDGHVYATGSDTAELYIMLLSKSVTMTQAADKTTVSGAKALLDYAQGRIKMLGITRNPDAEYEPDLENGIDADSLTAMPKAHELASLMAEDQKPIRVLIEGREFDYDNIGDLEDLTAYTYNRVAMVLWSTKADGSASVGYTLGVKAGLPVQRKLSRVANGQLPISEAYIGVDKAEGIPGISTIHDKGYITLRTYPTRAGYYFTGEPVACLPSDDYAILSRGLVIDKAQRIAYNTFLDELEEDVEVDGAGQLLPGYKAYLEKRITNAITLSMTGQISGVRFSIPDGQNILSDNKTRAILAIIPKGYQTYIEVLLGFSNPALN